jgi:hypothetical protein
MRARTIGQIATLIAGHIGGCAPTAAAPPVAVPTPTAEPIAPPIEVEVDLDALSSEQIDRLFGNDEKPVPEAASHV